MTNQQSIKEPVNLSQASRAGIDHWVAKFPEGRQQSALLMALTIVQKENGGHLTDELMDAVADYLKVPRILAYEVATFYTLYDLSPTGRNKVYVCTNVSCQLCGSDEITSHLKEKLGIGFKETTSDGRITLYEVECLGACGGAPMMQVNDTYHENLTNESVDAIIDSLT